MKEKLDLDKWASSMLWGKKEVIDSFLAELNTAPFDVSDLSNAIEKASQEQYDNERATRGNS